MKRKITSQQKESPKKARKIRRKVEIFKRNYKFAQVGKIAKSIKRRGFAVVNMGEMENLQVLREKIDKEILNFPEFKENAIRSPLGGFSAYGTPSSFHNPTVRILRMTAYERISAVLDELKPTENHKKEAIIDRLMVRPSGASPSAESWHRDESLFALDDDLVLGGWWNFDDKPNYFSCVKGSHRGVHGNGGFAKVSKEAAEEFSSKNIHVEIPPGHVIIFNEQIAHEVLAKKLKYDSYRLFLGWRITTSEKPLDKDLLSKLDQQCAMMIKSGQEPPMWAKLHWTNWVEKLAKFSENFKKACTQEMTVKTGKNEGKSFNIVHRHMLSLDHYKLPKYPQYDQREIGILTPH